jgi:hypothetical protein
MMSTITPRPQDATRQQAPRRARQLILYSHSQLLYWWPLWLAGYAIALATWFDHIQVNIGGDAIQFHPSRSLGVAYCLLFVLLLLVNTVKIRGAASFAVVSFLAFVVVLLAYLGWWDWILSWLGGRPIYMDLGFYLFFSTAILVIWVMTVFVFDHLSFWRVRPGQVTHEFVLGAVDRSYDTDNLVFTKRQDDFFRHWLLGLGSGDLQMQTMGGLGPVAEATNVLFAAWKIAKIQRLIATKPDQPQQA